MTVTSNLSSIIDNTTSDTEFYVEIDDVAYGIGKIKVTYEDDELTEVTFVADSD